MTIGAKSLKLLIGQQLSAWKMAGADWRRIRQVPSGRPVFITGAPRSGTTWAASMLATPGTWHLHEPFNPNKGIWPREFDYVPAGSSRVDVDRMIERIRKGGHRRALHIPRTAHPMMPLRWMPVRYNRLLIKDPLACMMAEYISENLNARTLVLFRHPAGFVHSIRRLGWPTARYVRQFLWEASLMNDVLGPYAGTMEQHARKESALSAAVLHACIYKVLWLATERNPDIHRVRFEDLAENPMAEFRTIHCRLGLPYDEEDRRRHRQLTHVEHVDHNPQYPYQVRRNSAAMAWNWRGHFFQGELDELCDVWREFDIPLYTAVREWQASKGVE